MGSWNREDQAGRKSLENVGRVAQHPPACSPYCNYCNESKVFRNSWCGGKIIATIAMEARCFRIRDAGDKSYQWLAHTVKMLHQDDFTSF
jgi:hypothetical protein